MSIIFGIVNFTMYRQKMCGQFAGNAIKHYTKLWMRIQNGNRFTPANGSSPLKNCAVHLPILNFRGEKCIDAFAP